MKMVKRHIEIIDAGLKSPLVSDHEKITLRFLNKFRDSEGFPLNTYETKLLSEIERRMKVET